MTLPGYPEAAPLAGLAGGVLIGLAAAVLGIPAAAAIGVVNFIGAYIPYIGAFVGGAFAVLMALGEGGIGLALVVLAITLAVNLAALKALRKAGWLEGNRAGTRLLVGASGRQQFVGDRSSDLEVFFHQRRRDH